MREKQYNQKLTPEQAAKGIAIAIKNSRELLDDAICLFNNKRYPRAVALAILSIEEAGKSSIIRSILLEDDPKSLKKEWQNYRKHTSKNKTWILPDLAKNGARHLEEMRPIFDESSDHSIVLENIKQLAFYSDIFANCKWSDPEEVITQGDAEMFLQTAKIMVRNDYPVDTKEELELWVKHLKPVWKKEMIKMKQALINFYSEAEEKGLIKEGTTKGMIDFVL